MEQLILRDEKVSLNRSVVKRLVRAEHRLYCKQLADDVLQSLLLILPRFLKLGYKVVDLR